MMRVAVPSALQTAFGYTHRSASLREMSANSWRLVSAPLHRLEEDDRDLPAGA